MMVFFKIRCVPDPAVRAVRMVVVMRERLGELTAKWKKRGFTLDFGAGIAQGYATIGAVGFEGRWDYGAIGTVTNLASRLCGEAQHRPDPDLTASGRVGGGDCQRGTGRRTSAERIPEAGSRVQSDRAEAVRQSGDARGASTPEEKYALPRSPLKLPEGRDARLGTWVREPTQTPNSRINLPGLPQSLIGPSSSTTRAPLTHTP